MQITNTSLVKFFLILISFLITSLHATEYDCAELYGNYKIVIRGTRNEARNVSTKRYTSKEYCYQDLDNYLNKRKASVVYDCTELYGDYRIVIRGTRDEARNVSTKRYTSKEYCYQDLDNYLNKRKAPVMYDCAELYGDYRIVFKGTRDEARKVSTKRYTSKDYCYQDLDNYLNKRKAPVVYDCTELYGDYRIVIRGTRDEARNISTKRYTSKDYCYQDLDNYLNKRKAPVMYDCAELYGDYRIVFKGTRDEARNVSTKRYISMEYCYQDLDNYLSKQR